MNKSDRTEERIKSLEDWLLRRDKVIARNSTREFTLAHEPVPTGEALYVFLATLGAVWEADEPKLTDLDWLHFAPAQEPLDVHRAYRQFERMLWPNGRSQSDTPGGLSYGIDH